MIAQEAILSALYFFLLIYISKRKKNSQLYEEYLPLETFTSKNKTKSKIFAIVP